MKKALVIILIGAASFMATSSSAEVIRKGPAACKAIALTFDLCPVREGGYDAPLIQTLIEHRIPATFFLSGRWMARHESEVRELLNVSFFEIGTHGQVHAHLPALEEAAQGKEIQDAVSLLRTRFDHKAVLFRPPYGEYDDTTVKITEALGLRFILWDVVSGDPDPALSQAQISDSVKAQARNGSIIVFHANGKGRHTRVVIEELYRDVIVGRGFVPVTVSTLLDQCGGEQNGAGKPAHH